MPSAKIISNKSNGINLSKTPYASLAKLVPSVTNNVLTFEIRGANCSLANAIRRTLKSELPVKYLTASLTDIKSSDPYILGDVIQKRLEMIPISQSIKTDAKFSIRFENNTDSYVDIMSTDIKLNGVSSSADIMPFIPLCDINSGTDLTINDIHVTERCGYDSGRVAIGRIGYEIIDHDMTQSSLVSEPTSFRLVVETPGVIDPVEITIKAIDDLINRVNAIDYDRAVIEFGVYKLPIINETHSIGHLMAWYVYQTEKTIGYVAPRTPHPSKREIVLDVKHPDAEAVCKKAVEAIQADLKALRKAFA